jgi:transcriptional regulator with XRE-family HTH domain
MKNRRVTMTLGQRIKIRREKRGLGIRELARVAHVRHATLSQLERGIRADVTTETAKRIARALGVSVDYLIGMYEDDEDPDPATVALVG